MFRFKELFGLQSILRPRNNRLSDLSYGSHAFTELHFDTSLNPLEFDIVAFLAREVETDAGESETAFEDDQKKRGTHPRA